MIHNFDLTKKTILITGGYGHLGKAITESLLFHGATVIVLAKDRTKFNQIFSENKLLGKSLYFEYCDISNSESIKKSFYSISGIYTIDVLINNAYYMLGQSPEEMTDDEWGIGIDGALNSVFRCIREVMPYLKDQGGGKIVNVSSMYGIVAPQFEIYKGFPQFLNPPHYGAAKAGIIQLTKYYASYLGVNNINVNAVSPGAFPSSKIQEEDGFVEELERRTCLNRIGKPEDLAGVFVFLASNASNYITGQNIVVDGGWTIK